MPIYEYACTSCGERTEAKQGFDDPPLEVCPNCGGKLRKLYSPVGIVFKGSGFYSTDAKSSSKSGSGDKGSASTPKSDSKSEAKSSGGSDAKSDSKKEPSKKETTTS
jgi:putative FmdB family regulatory protein